jgi:hypothetical protein
MRSDVKRDLEDSAYDFKRVVWPAIKGLCPSKSPRMKRRLGAGMPTFITSSFCAGTRGVTSPVTPSSR